MLLATYMLLLFIYIYSNLILDFYCQIVFRVKRHIYVYIRDYRCIKDDDDDDDDC